MTTTYVYKGPVSGVTLDDGTSVTFNPYSKVTLPEEHDYVAALRAQGYLEDESPQSSSPLQTVTDAKKVKSNQSKKG